jgi:predicted O-methyltransferase YrrM
MNHFYKDIQGWSAFIPWYKEAVSRAPTNRESIFVEIGCWKGRSAAYMGVEIANSGKPITFYTIDTFQGSDEPAHKVDPIIKKGKLYEHATKNLRPVDEFVQIIMADSVRISSEFEDDSVDFLLIDGDHTHKGVTKDLQAWYPKIKTGGIIAGDDWRWNSVRSAVEEFFPNSEIETDFGPEKNKCWRVRKPR